MNEAGTPAAITAEVVGFLRALGVALGVVRLHPEQPERFEVRAALERVRETAAALQRRMPLTVDVTADGLVHRGAALASDTHLDRLASACFERRVEHIRLERTPSERDLAVALEVLTTPAAKLPEQHDPLAPRGVTALRLLTGGPQPETGEPVAMPEPSEHEASRGGGGPGDVEIDVRGITDAETLYERLREIHDGLRDEDAGRSTFFHQAAKAVAALPGDQRGPFGELALDGLGVDLFARRYLGHLTDFALARLTTEVAEARGSAPADVARQLVARVGRQPQLARAIASQARSEAERVADEAPAADDELLAALREELPTAPDEVRSLTLRTLLAYCLLEHDGDRLERVFASIRGRLRASCVTREVDDVTTLLATFDEIAQRVHPEWSARARAQRRAVLDPQLVETLAVGAVEGGTPDTSAALLESFGQDAVDALVDTLAEAEESHVRGVLTGLLAGVVGSEVGRLDRHLGTRRWYVARNLATTLARIGTVGTVSPLARLAAHEHPAVRREAVGALGALPVADAAQALARLAREPAAREARAAYVDALAAHPAPQATPCLEELGSRSRGGGLPWRLRRRARAHARSRKGIA